MSARDRREGGVRALVAVCVALGALVTGCAEAHVALPEPVQPAPDADVPDGAVDAAQGPVDAALDAPTLPPDLGATDLGPRSDVGPLVCDELVATWYHEISGDPVGTVTITSGDRHPCWVLGVRVSTEAAAELDTYPGVRCLTFWFVDGVVCMDEFTEWGPEGPDTLEHLCWLDAAAGHPEWACLTFGE